MAFKPRKDACGFLGCPELHLPDSYMCQAHEDFFSQSVAEFAQMEDPYGTRTRGEKKSVPQCTVQGCKNPRAAGRAMCADCAEEAFWSGEDEEA